MKRQSAGKPLPHSSSATSPLPAVSILLIAFLAVLALARLVFPFVPGMAVWGLNVQRFLAPPMAWVPWALAALALLPAFGRRVQGATSALVQALDRNVAMLLVLAAIVAALLVWVFPDRIGFVGDFAMRLGSVRRGESPETLSPQAFPLDIALHFRFPLWFAERLGCSDADAVRLIGAAGAALLGVFAVLLGRALDERPLVRLAVAAVAFFGGYLCLFTGESKAFAELCIAVVALAAFALRARTPGAVLGMGLVFAVATGLHRYALGLLPAFLVVMVGRLRAARQEGGVPISGGDIVGVSAPLASLAWVGPHLARTVLGYDLEVNFAVGGGASVLEPARLLDLANLLVMLSPLAMLAPLVTVAARRAGQESRGHGIFVLALVAPFVIAFLVARPPQGVVRDWDSFAVPGAAFSVAAAWAVARALSAPSATWLAIPVALAVSMPAVQWLAHYADLPRAMARIEALLEGPPVRSADERSRLWDMVGMKRLAMGDAPASAHAFEKAAEAAPSPRLLTQWGMAEAMAGRHDRALASYRRAVERDSSYVTAWIGIGVSGLNAGDLESASRAVAMLERLAPGNPKTREIADALRARSSSP